MMRMAASVKRTSERKCENLARSFVFAASLVMFCPVSVRALSTVRYWVSSEDLSKTLTSQPVLKFAREDSPNRSVITVDENKTYQTIIGLGSSLEHSTCYNISLLPRTEQEKVVERIVGSEKGIGMNLMRICIGTPDFTGSPWYSYDDMPTGQKDPRLKRFSIEKDRQYVLPILKLALEKNPELRFFAAPWSPPAWMKTNDNLCGGRIDPRYFGSYAEYLARFVEAYRAEGIEIVSVTPQNEPEFFPDSYPTCGWTAVQQRDFIRDHLGPVFRRHGLSTRIWCYDHNFNHPNYPAEILGDPQAAQYIDGTAFHHYEGKPSAMSVLHEQFPDKHIYFTEGSTFDIGGAVEIVTFLRNWAKCYNAWVTIIDDKAQPNPGPHDCSPTCIVLNSRTLELEYRFDYYMYGQFSKFIRRGAIRIGSDPSSESLPSVAFRNPDNSIVLIVVNPMRLAKSFAVVWNNSNFVAQLDAGSLATFVWHR
ncbi:MAG: glycoside hydrolase family 30 protein [Planctomycetota bacterium]